MKFCTNCGNKLDSKNKFCTNCGKEIKNEVVKKTTTKKDVKKVEEPKKEFNVNNLVLYVGVSLVILATFIFAICTWENMSGLFKISFLTFETLLFFIISFTFAKIKNNGLSKAFYLMAVLMIPVILYTIPVYALLGEYLSYEGAGIFVYLAISNCICAGIYLMSYLLLKTKAYTYISYVFIYAFITNVFLAFEKSITFFLLASLIFVLIVIIINFINRKENYFRKSITNFTSIFFSILSFFMVGLIIREFEGNYIKDFGSINIYLVLITVLFFVNTFVFIYQNRKSFYTYFSPFIMVPVLFAILNSFTNNEKVFACVLAGATLLIYVLYLLFKNKYLKITFKIITYITLYLILLAVLISTLYATDYFLTLAIVSLFVLGFNLINRFTERFKWMSDILIPLSCLFMVIGIVNLFIGLPAIFIVLLVASIYLVIYMILKSIDRKSNKIYFWYTFAALVIAFFMCTYGTASIYIIFLNVLLVLLFIFVSFMEKSKALNITTFIVLALSLLKINTLFDIDGRIIVSCISLVSITVGIILRSASKGLSKFYLFFGQIISLIIALTVTSYTSYIVITLVSALFIVNFISICLYNNYKAYRIIAEIIGLILIFSIVNALIEVTLFSTIISLFIYMVILVILGLTGKENAGTLIIVSTASLIPYYDYVLSTNTGIGNQLMILPFIAYLFTMAFYFKMNYETRMHVIIWPLILFSMIAINTTTIGIIVSLSLALIYIFIGIIKKYMYLVSFGIIYILVILVFELFKMFNNIALIIAVLVIGLALITYVVINEVYKSRKNK